MGTNCMKAKRDCRGRVHSDQIILKAVRQGGWTV
jgi:hypothetical protein